MIDNPPMKREEAEEVAKRLAFLCESILNEVLDELYNEFLKEEPDETEVERF